MDGELVASLTPAQRMDMIQKGYIPGHEEDVRRYFDNQKPVGDAAGLAVFDTGGGFSLNSLGEKKVKGNFNLKQVAEDDLDKHYGEYNLDEYEEKLQTSPVINPREEIKQTMNSYSSRETSLDSKVDRILGRKAEGTQTIRKPSPQRQQNFDYEETEEEIRKTPVLGPNAKRQQQSFTRNNLLQKKEVYKPTLRIQESQRGKKQTPEQIKRQGYNDGVKYLNSFIRLLKSSNAEERDKLTSALSSIIEIENNLASNMINLYREGLKQAEQQVYGQIKSSRK